METAFSTDIQMEHLSNFMPSFAYRNVQISPKSYGPIASAILSADLPNLLSYSLIREY